MSGEFYLHFEDVLPKTGWGLYYKFMIGMACASCFANASAFLCIPIAIPLSSCETEITPNILYAVFISFTIGRSFGGIVDCFCDIFGRKRLLTQSLVVNFVTTFMAAFAYNSYMIIFAVFFLGSSLEHQRTVVKIHLAEILPTKKRGRYLALCDLFWMLGFLQASVVAYYFASPSYVEHRVIDMRVTTWRMMFAISGGINLILACATALLEESPRFFLHAKKDYLAVLTLKQFYAINKSSYGNSFDIKEDDIMNTVLDYGLLYQSDNTGCLRITFDIMSMVGKGMKLLFSRPFLTVTLPLIALQTSLSILNIVSMNILMAKLVTSENLSSGLDVVYLHPYENNTMCPRIGENKLFYNFLMISTNVIIGEISAIWILDRVGRKIPLYIECLLMPKGFLSM
ncbi:putative transporter svop-1 [Diorhabda sublineata]|uniref:putative transporter svop-1 n=1 Tax=Diorhabda sublineata TaxID=1163346 RepID=UPI0024E0E2B2|nr:putative transporter svop-1 [Diorhabda sublineata]